MASRPCALLTSPTRPTGSVPTRLPGAPHLAYPGGDQGRWCWGNAAPTVAAVPTAATAARNTYWAAVAKIWSGTPSATPSAIARQLAAAVSAHRAISSAQTGPMI